MYEAVSPSPVDMDTMQPISRTYQYRKVMKPMLERKRRARINRCLDELKELMVSALQSEGENVSKLEKADILELTVQHLHKLRKQRRLCASPSPPASPASGSSGGGGSGGGSGSGNGGESERFRAGYTSCAAEVSKCLASTPGVDVRLGTKLMTHLGHRLVELDRSTPLTVRVPQPPPSPAYSMPLTPASSRQSDSPDPLEYSGLLKVADSSLWRPW